MLSTLISANRHPLLREFIWFVIFCFTLSCMPHLEMLFPYRFYFSHGEAEAAEVVTDTAPQYDPVPADQANDIRAADEKAASLPPGEGAMTAGSGTDPSGAPEGQMTSSISFKVDDFTGAGHASYPIAVPPGRDGLQPRIVLGYSSGGANSPVGVGWDIPLGQIQRKGPRKGIPKYNDTEDVYELQLPGGGPQELVKVTSGTYSGEYRLKVEEALLRIKYISATNSWEVTDKSGIKMKFGQTSASRIGPNPSSQSKSGILRWCLDRVEDPKTNYMVISYQKPADSPGAIYPSQIDYNGQSSSGLAHNLHIYFNLETTARPDPIYSYRGGFKSLIMRRLASIEVRTGTGEIGQQTLVRRYNLQYSQDTSSQPRSRLASIKLWGSDYGTQNAIDLPPVTFTYQTHSLGFQDSAASWPNPSAWGATKGNLIQNWDLSNDGTFTDLLDMNGDGMVDRVIYYENCSSPYNCPWTVYWNSGSVFVDSSTPPSHDVPNWPNPSAWDDKDGNYIRSTDHNKGTFTDLIDLNGDGLPDRVVYNKNCTSPFTNCPWTVYWNNGNGFDTQSTPNWENKSAWGAKDGNYIRSNKTTLGTNYGTMTEVVDMNNDGLPDRVVYDDAYNYSPGVPANWKVYWNLYQPGSPPVTGFSQTPVTWLNYSPWDPDDRKGNTIRSIRTDGTGTLADLIDMNGDGMPDRVVYDKDYSYSPGVPAYWKVYLNNGSGFEQNPISWPNPSPWGNENGNNIRDTGEFGIQSDVVDVNGDGLPDRVVKDLTSPYETWTVYFNYGSGFGPGVNWPKPNPQGWGGDHDGNLISENYTDSSYQYGTKAALIDIDGDGLPDRVLYEKNYTYNPSNPQPANWTVYLNRGPFTDLLSRIDNGIGGYTEIAYKPSTFYTDEETGNRANAIPFPIQTVYTYSNFDGRSNQYTTQYHYETADYDYANVEFLGFGRVISYQMRDDGWEAKTETEFHQRNEQGQPDQYRKGKPQQQMVESHEGHTKVTDYLWNSGYNAVGGGKFPALDSVMTTAKDKDGEIFHEHTSTSRYVYDIQPGSPETQTLNLKEEYKNEGATGRGEEIRTFTDFEQLDWDKWVLSRPTRVTVKDRDGGVYSRKWMDYDGDDKRLVREEFCKTTDPTPVADNACTKNSGNNPVIQYTYDTTYKMLTEVIDPRGYKTKYAYESTNTHIRQTTNCIDLDCTESKSHVTTMERDIRTGSVIKLVPPHLQATGYWLQTQYDGLGRKSLERLKDNSDPDIDPLVDRGWTAYEYNFSNNANTQYVKKQEHITVVVPTSEHPSPPPGCTGLPECKVESQTLNHDAFTYFDGMGRPYKQTSTGPGEPLILVTTDYDPDINRVLRKSTQHFEGETPYYTEFDYDGFSRVIITTTPDDQIIETAYKGLDKVVTNQRGYPTTYTMDLNGKTVGITDAYGTLTTYAFDVMGNLRTVVAAVGRTEENETSMTYNSLSKKIGMSDPDMGSWLYEYDSSGNLTLQTDARGQKIRFEYVDGLNRVTRKHYGDPNPDSTVIYAYEDSAIPYSKGKLTSVSYEPSGEDMREDLVLELDQLQRVKYSSKQTGSLVKEFKKTYDSASRVITVTYLVGTGSEKKYNYGYDRAGNLLSLQDDDTSAMVVQYSDFTALGQPRNVMFQNSVTTTYTYYPDAGRVNTIETVKPGTPSTVYQDLTYTYDEVGDLTVIEDALNNLTHTYGYDPLNRLDWARGTDGNDQTVYDHDYNYDRIGNVKSKTDAGGDYEYTISNKPHTVRKIWTNINHEVQKYGFEYDANGNMMQRRDLTGAQEVRLDLVYNYDNMPVSVDKTVGQTLTTTVTFVYDGNGQRVKKGNQTGQTSTTTYYFGELYEEREGSGDFIHIFAGSRRVATVPVESGCTRFYHPNHLGSASAVTKDDGDWVEKIDYYPFGTYRHRQDNDGTCPNVNFTFTDQEDDVDIGLYNYGARLYDPLIGRFISPDTIVPYANDPQTLNRYSYVNNNPLIYTDPSGNIFIVDDLALILGSMLAAKLIVGAAAGAVLGAGMAAATGGNIGTGALTGAISGMAFAGAGALVGELGLAGAGATFGDKLATVGIHAAAGAISGGINSAITGGNIGIGAVTGGISGGIGMAVGSLNFIPKDFGYQLASRSFAGAVSGGIAAELSGADFWEGFRQGAMTAAAGYLFNCALSKLLLVQQTAGPKGEWKIIAEVPPGTCVQPTVHPLQFLNDVLDESLALGEATVRNTDALLVSKAANELAKAAPIEAPGGAGIVTKAFQWGMNIFGMVQWGYTTYIRQSLIDTLGPIPKR
jgi:RHS repeat-associated protein